MNKILNVKALNRFPKMRSSSALVREPTTQLSVTRASNTTLNDVYALTSASSSTVEIEKLI